ncbi:MAG: flagellar basal body-associated FliL family protein [Rhodospirillales bacterium]|nr:flagellar basal body-associated FliL family protein [Rhodospirillales bacterium]
MAEEPEETTEELEEIEGEEDLPLIPPSKGLGKKKIIIIAAALVVVLGGGAGGAYFLGIFDSLLGIEKPSKTAVLDLGAPVFHEFPQLKADLKVGGCKSPLLKATFVVQLAKPDLKRLKSLELRVLDAVTQYLRDHERQEFVGKKGAEKLRGETVRLINKLIAPSQIHAVIFKEFIVQ